MRASAPVDDELVHVPRSPKLANGEDRVSEAQIFGSFAIGSAASASVVGDDSGTPPISYTSSGSIPSGISQSTKGASSSVSSTGC